MKGTLLLSDAHYGDAGQYCLSFRKCVEDSIRQLKECDERVVIVNGDMVAGQGIFREQFAQNLLQFGPEQVTWAAWDIREWDRDLKATWHIIRGNHDHHRRANMAHLLAVMLHLFGVKVKYHDRAFVGNFAPYAHPDHYFEAQHGAGSSSYYANSYSEIRNCWAKFIELARQEKVVVSRFMRAHSHWLNVGQTIGNDVAIDTTGGWHRQERMSLSDVTRIPGVILYRWQDELDITTIPADKDTLFSETKDRTLHYRNMAHAAEALSAVDAWGTEQGLWG
jgi:hypothetical protein